ncbi:MAG: ATP-binding protein [Solirubrobacteraceae bacterium]
MSPTLATIEDADAPSTDDVPTTGTVVLAPDPRSLDALGRNHTLEAALAELVDNSIDAEARHVLIRFVRDGSRLLRLLVIDDGIGMDAMSIDVAMTVGGARSYGDDQIGRFGLGLKAASFSQARSVTVVSAADGHEVVGRRWQIEQAKKDYRCAIVEPTFAAEQLSRNWGFPESNTGTLVRWDDVKAFPIIHDEPTVERFLQDTVARVRTHLGLIFHRILEGSGIRVVIAVEDGGDDVYRHEVTALNPFGYTRTGARGWPKALVAGRDSRELTLTCHIWPGRSTAEQYRLDGKEIERQGLYVYYKDRLVQRGGWNGLTNPDKQLNLARVAVDLDGDVERMIYLKPEKNGIEVGPEFGPAVKSAEASGGRTFAQYLDEARGVMKASNRRDRSRPAILPPGIGIPAAVRRAFCKELPFKDEEAIEVLWADFADDCDDFFGIDRKQGVLWLNKRYRKGLSGGRRGSVSDVPVVKALMFLLMEHIFAGQNMGPRDRDNVDLWQAILTAAAKAEIR